LPGKLEEFTIFIKKRAGLKLFFRPRHLYYKSKKLLTTEETILKAKKGDKLALDSLVKQSYQKIYNVNYRYLSDYDKAMDATQKTFILMFRKINSLSDHQKFNSWLYQIAINCCREESRREKRNKVLPFMKVSHNNVQKLENDAFDNAHQPDAEYSKNETQQLVLSALNQINPEQKEVLILKEFEGLKFKEIAEMLHVSENTVKSRLYYGLSAMKKIFEKWNIDKENISYGI
jgi:RNA polymerase sigma-70 factor (ECF subfamily)